MIIGLKKKKIKKTMKWNIENIALITLQYLQMNQVSTLNNPKGVDMPLNK